MLSIQYTHYQLTVTNFNQDYLYSQLTLIAPMKHWQSYINQKKVLLNGKPLVNNTMVNEKDVVTLTLNKEELSYPVDNDKLTILYEDEMILIVDKPRGCIIYDSEGKDSHTLCNKVAYYYQTTKQQCDVHYVHRLDKETTGCILFVKHAFFLPYFDGLLREKLIKREYIALLQGILNKPVTINKPIGVAAHQRNKRVITPKGQSAITDVTPLFAIGNNTLVLCQLHSGRTHQIRVHCASIHHPLVHDELYGTSKGNLALHSYHITFNHLISNQVIDVYSTHIDWLNKQQLHQLEELKI